MYSILNVIFAVFCKKGFVAEDFSILLKLLFPYRPNTKFKPKFEQSKNKSSSLQYNIVQVTLEQRSPVHWMQSCFDKHSTMHWSKVDWITVHQSAAKYSPVTCRVHNDSCRRPGLVMQYIDRDPAQKKLEVQKKTGKISLKISSYWIF